MSDFPRFPCQSGSKVFSCSKLQFQFIPLFPATVPCHCWCFRSWAMSAMSYVKLPQLPPPRVASMWCSSVEPDTISTAPVEPGGTWDLHLGPPPQSTLLGQMMKWPKMRNENYGIFWKLWIWSFMNLWTLWIMKYYEYEWYGAGENPWKSHPEPECEQGLATRGWNPCPRVTLSLSLSPSAQGRHLGARQESWPVIPQLVTSRF